MYPVHPRTLLNIPNDPVNIRSARESINSANSICTPVTSELVGFKFKVENFLNDNLSPRTNESLITQQGVFAAQVLENNSFSLEVTTVELLRHSPRGKINVRTSSNGILKPTETIPPSWLRSIKLSPDIHSYNSILEITQSKSVRLRISKKILPGEEVVCWFSEEVAALMYIPFLVPGNIIGNNCYQCHVCKFSFESPNPLKIHMAIACGAQPIDILWMRLHCGLQKTPSIPTSFGNSTGILDEPKKTQRERSHFDISASCSLTTSMGICSSRLQPLSSSSVSAAAQIETIVSNMGTSKQGHLCIYCGKMYSRKYGLKIHIRTHTGFKPLKCKFCLRPFGDPSNLNKHVRLHIQAGNQIYKCNMCDKTLARRRDLQRHVQSAHSQRTSEKLVSSDDD